MEILRISIVGNPEIVLGFPLETAFDRFQWKALAISIGNFVPNGNHSPRARSVGNRARMGVPGGRGVIFL